MSQPVDADDRAIYERLIADLEVQPWANLLLKNIVVQNGVVHLWGYTSSEDERRALRVAAMNVDGVKGVEDHMRQYHVSLWD